MRKHKPSSILAVFNMLDEQQNLIRIDGKEVILCAQQNSLNLSPIHSLQSPMNKIMPTKHNRFQHNAIPDLCDGIQNMNL